MKFLMYSAMALAIASPAAAQMPAPSNEMATKQSAQGMPSTQSNDPATILKTEFPAYDKDATGDLNKEEFSAWLLALKKATPQQAPLTDKQQGEWLGKAFIDAYGDKSTSVSLAELTSYLTRGSGG